MQVLADGRVRRSRSEWQAILRRFKKSGLTIAAFCKKEKVSQSAFMDWRRRLGAAPASLSPFIELSPSPAVSIAASPLPIEAGEFELTLPGGVVLRWKA